MAAAAADLPNWVMLERFVFRRDDAASFREDKRTTAASVTSTGVPFRISFILADPPTPSRLYISFPGGAGPKDDGVAACHLVSAHRNLVLLRLDILLTRAQFGPFAHDYFVYIAGHPSQPMPALKLLPAPMRRSFCVEQPLPRPFEPAAVGLLCHGDQEFTVAYLAIRRGPEARLDTELWVLHSSIQSSSTGGNNWEIKHIPIHCKVDERSDLFYWGTNAVVPFKNSLCWVNYSQGVLICDGVSGDSPRVSYIRFPMDSSSRNMRKELYRSLCVTEGGEQLELVDVAREDGEGLGRVAPCNGFTISRWKARATVNDRLGWFDNVVVSAEELWKLNTPENLPRELMLIPLGSMDKANAVHVVLYDWAPVIGNLSLVTIDLETKKTLSSVVVYIRGVEDLSSDDGDMVRLKRYCFAHFLPSEFPKFLHLDQ
ncbi:hypothetical protein ACP70R_031166 [Stipagrostis hirtigluma subsp. patula]